MGTTCFPERDARAVGVAPRPRVTLAMIRAAWRDTPFAKPMAVIQPPGNRTLVNIPTYFQASWPVMGYAPQEVNTVTLLGQRVRIRPTLEHFTYSYGDGQTLRTTSAGGGYPDGDVQHTYVKKGIRTVRIDATYGGEFSLDGGEWTPIAGTVTIQGPTQQLTVLTAKNRLLVD